MTCSRTSSRSRVLVLVFVASASGVAFGQGGARTQQAAKKPLANTDILNLLRAGTAEPRILAAIQNQPAKFDVSRRARARFDRECNAIKPASVRTGAWATEIRTIWDAMVNVVIAQETNGRGGEGVRAPKGEM